MKQNRRCSGVLIVVLCVALAAPARAQSGGKIESNGKIAGVIVAIVASVVVVTFVAIHYSRKRTITGCVSSGERGLSITDEKDRQLYLLSGNLAGIKPGDRMKVQGKKKEESQGANQTLDWQAKAVSRDFGVCHP
jgi:hypothetical protein